MPPCSPACQAPCIRTVSVKLSPASMSEAEACHSSLKGYWPDTGVGVGTGVCVGVAVGVGVDVGAGV